MRSQTAKVTEQWFDTPPSGEFHREDQVTGADGVVHFQPHYYSSGFGLRVFGCIVEIVQFLYHGSCGVLASVDGFKCGYGYLSPTDVDRAFGGHDWNGKPSHANTSLFLRYCPNGGTGRDCDILGTRLNLNCRGH